MQGSRVIGWRVLVAATVAAGAIVLIKYLLPGLAPLGPGWDRLANGALIICTGLLAIGGLLYVLVYVLGGVAPSGGTEDRSDPALEILKQRYARGEITTEEYRRMLDELRRP
ncbi:SHOCT domain-containing protein [Candidatus Bipolaricaulota bacterium]|nr:SHOCT domain-containing protein [Candidatus Bipolaricaulota bacterium]